MNVLLHTVKCVTRVAAVTKPSFVHVYVCTNQAAVALQEPTR